MTANLLEGLAALPVTQAIGWTVVHFLWQGTVIAAGVGIALRVLRGKSTKARYAACCVAMTLMLVTPLCTLSALLSAGGTPPGGDASAALSEIAALSGWQRITPLLPWITLLWLSGFSLLQGRTLLCWTRARRLKLTNTRPLSPAWRSSVSRLCDRVGVRRAVRVVESTVADVPMLIGWLSPVILIPTSALCGLTREQLEAVLAHELAHVRRHDTLVNLAQAAVEALLFFHPAVWWISDRMRIEREYCCDDVAVEVCGDTLCYARALSSLEHLRDVPHPAVAANGGSLMDRISRLVGTRPSAMSGHSPALTPLLLAVALAVMFGVAGLALAGGPATTASEPDPERARQPAAEDRLRRQIATQEATLARLQRQLERQEFTAEAEERREAERDAIEDRHDEVLAAKLEAQLDLERELAARHRDGAAVERDDLLELERALAMAKRGDADAARLEAQLDLERELAARHRDGAAVEHDDLLELERALALAHEGAPTDDGDEQRRLDRTRMKQERYARDAERGAKRSLRDERERAREQERFLHDKTDAGRGTPESLRRELAVREAAIRELSHELAMQRRQLEETLRDLERLEAGEAVGEPKKSDKRKQLY